jgi:ferrous iron transport protein B
VDATNIERNLYLTLQLLELRIPMVVALNMMDEVHANGGSVDVQLMSRQLGVPVVPIAASKNEGVSELVNQAVAAVKKRMLPAVQDFCPDGAVHRCIHSVAHVIEDHARGIGVSPRFCATKLIEGDENFAERLDLDQNERELIEHSVLEMEHETGFDRNEALADMRYTFIENVVEASVVKCCESREHRRSVAIDRILTGKYTALPVFLGVMFLVFWLTFNVIGNSLSGLLTRGSTR